MSVSPSTSMICRPRSDKEHSEKREPDDDLWLDKQCLEPITSVPGCSRLCNACLWVLQRSVSQRFCKDTTHLRYRTTLSSLADRGCHLCIHLLDQWDEHVDDNRATAHIMSHAYVALGKNGRVVFFYRDVISSKSVKFYILKPACESHFTCNPIQVVPRHSNPSS